MNKPPWYSIQICLVLLTVIACGGALYWLRPVMIPFVLAVLLMYGMAPVVDFIVARGRLGQGLAIVSALALSGLVLVLVAVLIEHSVNDLRTNSAAYTERLKAIAQQAEGLLTRLGVGSVTLTEVVDKVPMSRMVGQLANGLVGLVSNGFLVLVFLIYLLLARTGASADAPGLRGEIERRVKRYIVVKVGLSAMTGTAVTLILIMLGVDLAMVFGLLAFFLNFIPNIGSILATLLPLPMVLVDPSMTPTTMILALALPGAVQLTIGNVVEPKMLGDSLELHPITILLSLIIWGMLWGIAGMVLAAPLTAVIKILCEPFELTRPFAELLAGRLPSAREEPA